MATGLLDDEDAGGSYAAVGDTSTTNIYVGNLDPSVCAWLLPCGM
jgi:hypothetical protein